MNSSRLVPFPATREPISLKSVDRVLAELRRGQAVAVRGSGGKAYLVLAAEAASASAIEKLTETSGGSPLLVLTARRATVLGLVSAGLRMVTVETEDALTAGMVRDLADPLSGVSPPLPFTFKAAEAEPFGCETAAAVLTKIARLLPAALAAPILDPEAEDLAAWASRHDLLLVDAGDVFQYENIAMRTLRIVSTARVPLLGAEHTTIVAFRPLDGGLEHLAVIIGEPRPDQPVLTRLHSECFTGDLLASLRCDCGDQLRGAIREIADAGSGLLLYLSQEGRGIGLVNKLRAYELQDRGFDTLDANEQLGFDADERLYLPAAHMLRHLGFERVRLLTNNPEKVSGLSRCGITVVERVPHAFPSNQHNEVYMRTKAGRGGHLF